jgi:hypothetical protein
MGALRSTLALLLPSLLFCGLYLRGIPALRPSVEATRPSF